MTLQVIDDGPSPQLDSSAFPAIVDGGALSYFAPKQKNNCAGLIFSVASLTTTFPWGETTGIVK